MTTDTTAQAEQLPTSDIGRAVDRVRKGYAQGLLESVESRKEHLRALDDVLVRYESEFIEALRADLGKPTLEAYGTEVGFLRAEIRHALRHIDEWHRPTKVRLPVHLRPGRAHTVREPLGTVLVIAPWNYPLQLLFAPYVPAVAGGNTVVLKPSEVAPATSAVVAEVVGRHLDPGVVAVVNGGVSETTELLAERFDHIFYTGNGRVGRIVMEAAARFLTPVTLELGGKSPAIVLADADIGVAARRIAWGKFLNAGQTCVAPDYVLVDERVEVAFTDALVRAVTAFYGDDPVASPDYGRIVDERHHDRLMALLEAGGFDATVCGGTGDRSARYIAPTVLSGVEASAVVMADEIFGPILPIIGVPGLDAAIDFVNERPKPLALYAFGSNEAALERVVRNTSAGGVCLNHVVLHLSVPELPFGGVGPSGMGSYHGRAGIDTFTHTKSVLARGTRPDPPVMYPPYSRWKERLVRRFL
jgi:aldehyde dehydrogenase (NAD+)